MNIQDYRFPSMLWMLLAVLALAGCAGAPQKPAVAETPARVFYPALPNSPRIQHLATISSERDLVAQSDGFADFILGDDKKTQQLIQPYGIAMYEGRMYVADTGAGALAVFDLARQKMEFVAGSGNGRMKRPINVKIDAEGRKYVTDTGRDQVLVYDREDRFVAAFGEQEQFRPTDVAIAGDRLYVVDIQHHQVHALDKRTGKLLFSFGKAGSADGELFHPTNIAIGPQGDVFVVDTSNFRVERFSAEGKFVRTYGSAGSEPGSFARPKGIAIDSVGRMYVGDAAFENVQLFDEQGRLLLFFGQPGDKAEGLNLPTGVALDRDNVKWFSRYASPDFHIEYLIMVASQFGPNKVDVFGFGRMAGMAYPPDNGPAAPGLGVK